MKKRFTFLIAALGLLAMTFQPLRMLGQTRDSYSYTFTSKVFDANNQTKTLNNVDWTFAGTGGDYFGYSAEKGQQFGSGNNPYTAFTLSTAGISGTITEIKVNTSGANSIAGTLNVTVGGNAFGNEYTLTKDATEVTFTGSGSGEIAFNYAQTSSKAIYIKSISVTYSGGGGATPSISANNVDIAYNATSGSIPYTISNPTPSISLTATTTANWVSNINVTSSAVTFNTTQNTSGSERTATFTLAYTGATDKTVTVTQAAAPVIYTTIPDLFAAATNAGSTATNVTVTFGNWVVSGVSTNGKNVFVTDGTNGFVIFNNNGNLGFAVGDVISGTAACKVQLYNGFAEITQLNSSTEGISIATGGTVTAANIEMANLAGINTGALVHYDNLTCSVTNNKYYLSDGTTTLQVYNSLYAFDALVDGKNYNITGVYQQFNSTKEVLPRSAADIVEVVADPVLTVSTTTLTNFTYTEGSGPSAAQSFTVSGSNLTANVTITAPTNFVVCATQNGNYAASLSLTQTSGTLAETTVYVKMAAGLSVNTYSGDLTAVSGTASKTIALSGEVTAMPVVETPTFTPAEGTYTEAQSVTIACATEGATIRYTLDGTDPTMNSDVYSIALDISATTTVKAKAWKNGYEASEVASATYTIDIPPVPQTFNKVSFHAAEAGRTYLIVDVNSSRALTSSNGTSSAPTAVEVTISNNAITTADQTLMWTFEAVENAYVIHPLNDETKWLYCINNNNGARVGTGNDNVWTLNITDNNNPNYHGFKNNGQNRYLGVYNNQDWRTYTSIHNNIKNTQIELFVLGDAPQTNPLLTVSATQLSGLNYTFSEGPSALQNFVITGSDLAENVAVAAPENFEIRLGYNGTFGSSFTLTPAGGIVQDTVYVRLAEGLAVNSYSGTLTVTSGTLSANVALSGSVTSMPIVATPVITPAGGDFIVGQTATITCETDNATIYYTLDGTEPTENSSVYNDLISINSTTTLKAVAMANGYAMSEVAEATFTIHQAMPIANARALANNEYACVEGTVIFIDGRNVYVQDATAGIDLYLNTNTVPSSLALGDNVRAYGKKTVYNGLVELTSINGNDGNQFVVLSNGNELPLEVTTIADIIADFAADNLLQGTRVRIENAIIGAINTNGNTILTQNGESINVYRIPTVEGLMEGDRVSLTAIVSCYNTIQLRVVSIDDIEFSHTAKLTATPATLNGLTYEYEDGGPSAVVSFMLSGDYLESAAYVIPSESFEVSTFSGDMFLPENPAMVSAPAGHFNDLPIYVRLKAGLEVGEYNERLALATAGFDTTYVNVSGSVTGQTPTPPTPITEGDYVRINDLSQLTDGSQVIIASRYNATANAYEAAENTLTNNKLNIVQFVSTTNTANEEILPQSIVDAEASYYWTVSVNGNSYTFTNANGNVLSYNSGTNFNFTGNQTAWAIANAVSDSTSLVPSYNGFLVTNMSTDNRAIALRYNPDENFNVFGAYSTSNMTNAQAPQYNFLLDFFVKGGEGGDPPTPPTPVVATPTFTPAAGTYNETQEVTINCTTEGATLYYSTVSENGPWTLYENAITVAESITIWAYAEKDGYDNSVVAQAEYIIEDAPVPPTPVEGDYVRINDLSQLTNGSQVIIASRYSATANAYEAAENTLTNNKLNIVQFVSTTNTDNEEILPQSIVDAEASYYWTVSVNGNSYTFTNANGNVLSYNSGTNFNFTGNQTAWAIANAVSDSTSLVPSYNGFLVTNMSTDNRAIALRYNPDENFNVFGAYSTSNMTNAQAPQYNFLLDFFVKGGEGGDPVTPTVAAPTFSPAAGTYYEAQEVSISCSTAGATIYYSTVSETGPWTEYEDAITVSEDMTIWAYAALDGYNDSPVASASYVINDDLNIIFNQDWESDWHGWTQVSVDGEAVWNIASYQGNHYGYINGYSEGSAHQNEDWLISPAFDLDAYTDVVLTFRTAKNYNGDDIEVFFSNDYDGQDPTAATWQTLECALSTGGWNWVESGAISMDNYNGTNCHIAFKYTSSDEQAAGWEVDDIMLVSGSAGIPSITATPNAFDFEYLFGQGPSASKTYILTSANLEGSGNVTVTASENFEIALDNANFGSTITFEFANGIITNQPLTVYVRMAAGLEAGTYTGTITHTGGGASATVNLTGIVIGEGEPYITSVMPMFIQGNNGTNNNRVPVATQVLVYNLTPNATYRYINQFVDNNDGPETAGAGNVIYANANGFYRSTSPSLSTEGSYGEFTTDENGEAIVWCINEPTANARFTPGNQVYLRIRINDGNDGTSVSHIFTTTDYATVLNFGTDRDAYQGTAFYAKSHEAPMGFAVMYANSDEERPIYATSIETVGVDYSSINQYANFYKDFVAGKDGWFGGILPNDNASGINYIAIVNMDGTSNTIYNTTNGFWQPEGNTVNPNGGLDEPIFIDLTYTSVEEGEEANITIWNTGNEFIIENGDDSHYTMTVYSLLGQAMMQRQINAGSTVRFSHSLAKGLYVIHLQNNRNSVSAKVIVR